jgi:outer membrane lipoprotein LolB
MSLQIQSEPPQAFFAAFELKGRAQRGELTLTSPIGSVLGVMRWSPEEAVLESGRDVKRFASVEALLQATTGAAIPINSMFDWLVGRNTSLNGWVADLAQQGNGKINARRVEPAPQIELRILLDR